VRAGRRHHTGTNFATSNFATSNFAANFPPNRATIT
jgi:hypothetical protein